MKKRFFAMNMIFAAAAAFTLAVLFCCIACDTAFAAQDPVSFTISTQDGGSWTLSQDGDIIAAYNGTFFNFGSTDAASAKFETVIKNKIASLGAAEYVINFDLPQIGVETEGETELAYNERQGDLLLRGAVEYMIVAGGTAENSTALQYRKKSEGEYKTFAFAEARGGGLTFGKRVDVGEYLVRFVAYEEFDYGIGEGNTVRYRVPRYSREIECRITNAIPDVPDVGEVSVEYGTLNEKLGDEIYDPSGSWTLSEEQDIIGFSENSRLGVKEGGYSVKFDYTPHNKNYVAVKGVEVNVQVTPCGLTVYVGDAQSFVGEPLAEDIRYEISSPLIDGDREEDLGTEICLGEIDVNTVGKYLITVRFANANYTPICRNNNNIFVDGGLYTVCQPQQEPEIPPDKSKSGYDIAAVVLLSVCCALAVIIGVFALVYVSRRRCFR